MSSPSGSASLSARSSANDYSRVNLNRLQSIAAVLGVQMRETITYESAHTDGRRAALARKRASDTL